MTNAPHPCIVKTYGGFWPDPEEVDDEEDYIDACIVMERMTHNLRHVQDKQLLNSLESKLRVLGDIAAGLAHLHRCKIVHRDIKPENVLMRVVDGHIVGRAKVCDFGVSRKAEETDTRTGTMEFVTTPTGTSRYMPPEAFGSSTQDANKRARDIWIFVVLMCELLVPDFLANIIEKHPSARTGSGQFAKEVTKSVATISCDPVLRALAASCLSLDPKLRPRIADVSEKLAHRMVSPTPMLQVWNE